MVEAMAMREGLQLATVVGCNWVQADSDSMEVVQACSGEETWWGESAAIFAQCVDIAMSICRVSFNHCPRETNKVANVLARDCFCNKLLCVLCWTKS
jgi:ribonuclease HI